MKRRTDGATAQPRLRAYYGVGALAALARVHRHSLRRLLEASGVTLVRSGRSALVPLCEIRAKIPSLYESLRILEAARGE